MDDLHAHAEKMIRAGATPELAEQRYIVPKRFQDYRLSSWDFTVGSAMRSYFAARRSANRLVSPDKASQPTTNKTRGG